MKRRLVLGAAGAAALLIAGCAAPVRPRSEGSALAAWSGRLSLRIESEPAQTFAALFDLRGAPAAGELTLTSPIGTILAKAEWSPGEALLRNGSEVRRFDSVEALLQNATGAAIPIEALFAWLAGRDERISGWQPDLSQVAGGRLRAIREAPLPRADLRIVFERA
ncbi:Outer membrane lipoprotein LolB [Burkholderiales bacterium 8X]|nr:Outer membrane lipoprotein LolB [Burkholderiales bacterium 8X]